MTAARAYDMCDTVELSLVTPEPAPLAVFGEAVSRDVAQLLSAAGIVLKARGRAKMARPNHSSCARAVSTWLSTASSPCRCSTVM